MSQESKNLGNKKILARNNEWRKNLFVGKEKKVLHGVNNG
jgi:hypothetical protein